MCERKWPKPAHTILGQYTFGGLEPAAHMQALEGWQRSDPVVIIHKDEYDAMMARLALYASCIEGLGDACCECEYEYHINKLEDALKAVPKPFST